MKMDFLQLSRLQPPRTRTARDFLGRVRVNEDTL